MPPMIGSPPRNAAAVATETTNTPIALSVSPLISWPTPGTTKLATAGTTPLPLLPPDFTSALLMTLTIASETIRRTYQEEQVVRLEGAFIHRAFGLYVRAAEAARHDRVDRIGALADVRRVV